MFSLATFLAALGATAGFHPWPGLIYAITVAVVIAYLVNEFEGWSPLVKFSFSAAYLHAKIAINRELCIGCGACIDVCPKAVYALVEQKSSIVNLDACVSCKSCFAQCPTGAIDHSAKTIDEAIG